MNKPFHAALFLGTCASTFAVFFVLFGGGVGGSTEDKLWGSGFYAAVVMLILLCHELGHYFMARAHGVDASLPYFIPFPLGFGTLGAVIRLKGRIPTKDALVDIGAAGPLAGLLIAIPMLFVGAGLSRIEMLPQPLHTGGMPTLSLINLASLAFQWAEHFMYDAPIPAFPAIEIFGDNLLTLLAVHLMHGTIPAGLEVVAHPVFIAAWFGMVITMLNLLPVGQLDGGHLTHAWFGEKAEAIGTVAARGALLLAVFFSASWLVWFFLITRVIGVRHPPVLNPSQPLGPARQRIVILTWVLTVLTFMPVPLSLG